MRTITAVWNAALGVIFTLEDPKSYKFSGDFDKMIDELSKVIWRDRDNYPLEVLLSAVGTNGARFVSNPLIVHQFKPEMVVYCLQNPINEQL